MLSRLYLRTSSFPIHRLSGFDTVVFQAFRAKKINCHTFTFKVYLWHHFVAYDELIFLLVTHGIKKCIDTGHR